MKNLFLLVAFVFVATIACKEAKNEEESTALVSKAQEKYQSFGDKISDEKVMSQMEMVSQFQTIQAGDSIPVKFTAKVNEVCQAKGCWMKMEMGEEEAMVKFKDYAFFMPKDLAGQEIIVEGLAFVNEMSVDEQRHYAEDAGKTPEEVAAITVPKRTLSIYSNGVLIPMEQ